MSSDTGFSWPGRSREAAAMLARGETWNATFEQLGIRRRTLERWHLHSEFVAEVGRLKIEAAEKLSAEGVANRQNRIDAYNERWNLMRQLVTERAADPEMETVPGGKTGLLVRTFKMAGQGRDAQLIPEYAVDTGLLKELRAHEQQAAQETGQWTEKRDISGELLVREYVGVPVETV